MAGGVADREDGGVRGGLFGGDGVEALSDLGGGADEACAGLAADAVGDDRGRREHAGAVLAEREHEGAVVEFADNEGVDAVGVEPEVERPADGGVGGGEEHGCAVEGLGEAFAVTGGEVGGGEEGDAALAEEVVEGAARARVCGGEGCVAEDDVEPAGGEVGKEAVGGVLVAGEADGLTGEAEGGFEQAADDGLGG